MTGRLERSTFEGYEGTVFTAVMSGRAGVADRKIEAVALTLSKVEDRSNDAVDAFTCLFHGSKAQEFGQATYRLIHETLGEIEVFLVPVFDPGSDGTTVCYQFIVSRLKE